MILWNEQQLKELVRRMKLQLTPGQGESPIHLSLYDGFAPLLTHIMRLNVMKWSALGYDEIDRVSVVRYLGSLGCQAGGAFYHAAIYQHPLTLELAKLLINSGAFDDEALSYAAEYQQPLTFELAKLLISAGCDPTAQDDDGRDALVFLAIGGHLADPQVTNLFLSAGCRTNLDGCDRISGEHCLRFDQILKERAQWKEKQDCLLAENSPADTSYGPDWDR